MQFIAYLLIYPCIWVLSKLPFKVLYLISDGFFFLVYHIIGYRKKTVRSNIKLAFPTMPSHEIKKVEKKFYHHLCDIFIEMIKSLTITEKELKQRYQFTNADLMVAYEKDNQSVVLVLGHFASYEWMFALQLYLKNPGHALYKKIRNKYFDRLVHKIRAKWKANLIASNIAMRKIKELENKGIVTVYGFAADQSPKYNRALFWTSFLGHDLPFQMGAERTAREFNLPVVFFGTTKTKRGHYKGSFQILSAQPGIEQEGVITASFAQALEKQIIAEPHFYLWTHKRFKLLGKKEEILAQFLKVKQA